MVFICLAFSPVHAGNYYIGTDFYPSADIELNARRGERSIDSSSDTDSIVQFRAGYRFNHRYAIEGILLDSWGEQLDVRSGNIEVKRNFSIYAKFLFPLTDKDDFYAGIGISSAEVDLVTDVDDGDGSPRIRNFKEDLLSPMAVLGYQRLISERVAINLQYTYISPFELDTSPEHDFISSFEPGIQGAALGISYLFE